MSGKLWTEEQFNCPVCLELPNDPVTIPCGHSYCMACIKDYWSKDDPKGIYSCPQCRQTFCPKPSLSRNTMLAEAVEQLRKTNRNGSTHGTSSSSSKSRGKMSNSAVQCDMCKGEARAAVKSCLACMSSFCAAHLKPHQTKKSLKQHELIPPTSNLAEKICTQHKYLQEFFCRQCKMFICWLCTSNQHKGHDCVSTKAERLEKQKVVSEMQAENQQRLKDREQELKDLQKTMELVKRSADRVHNDTGQVLLELQRSVERLQELLEDVLDRANMEKLGHAQEVTDNLEAEIEMLKKRDAEMKDLVQCEDNIHYLQMFESLRGPLDSGNLPVVRVNLEASFEPVRDTVLDLREQVEDLCNQELSKITKQVNDTTLLTLGDAKGSAGPKAGILKLFSGLGQRNTNQRSPGLGLRGQDVRSRDTPRDQERPRDGQRTRERERKTETVRETHPSPGPSPAPSPAPSSAPSPAPSTNSGPRLSIRPTPTPSPAPSHRESRSLWSRSSQINTTPTPAVPPAPAPAPRGGFSRMASISSIFRSHRRGTTPATPISSLNDSPPVGANSWGMTALPETPTEVNPGLFLDLPESDSMNLPSAFPGLREINFNSIEAAEPRTREEFLQYSVSQTLNPASAHRRLLLSEGNTKASLQAAAQPCTDTPQRFDGWTQVMCQSPLHAQRSYWEVEWRGRGSSVGVAYGALSRKGSDARAGIGYNAQSWTLELSDTCCTAMHDNDKKDIPITYSPRLGVYLDLSAGALSFYSVAENLTHLHTFRANFTQPLYAAFGVGCGVGVGLDFALGQFSSITDSVKICPI